MSVTPTRLKTLGVAMFGSLALGACEDPVANTDLRPEGPPDVLAVLVFNDPITEALEAATYCKPNDPKRPGKVGVPAAGENPVICPLDGSAVPELTDAWPDRWYVRIIFDELLDPDVETLDPIPDAMGNPTDTYTGSLATTQPVTLKCQDVSGVLVDVDYDGYYSPSGNTVTWPLGPSLVIQPLDPTIVPVESRCEVALKKDLVKDKDGNPVPDADLKPFTFKLAPISMIAVGPGDGDTIAPSDGGVEIDFNVEIDPDATFCTDIADPECAGDATRVFSLTPLGDPDNSIVDNLGNGLFIGADLLGATDYTLTVPQGLKIKDKCGKESVVAGLPDTVEFSTDVAKFLSANPGGGTGVAPSKKMLLSFNQVLKLATFVEGTDWDLSPKPARFLLAAAGGGTQIRFLGDFQLGTTYTLTIKAGASISDPYGPTAMGVQTIDFPDAKVFTWTTATAISILSQSPANGARITKDPTAAAQIRLTFNQEMSPTSLNLGMVSLTKADGGAVAITPTVAAPPASGVTSAVAINYNALPAGSYKFTLKAGATLVDALANTYTQAADRVISFSVADAAAAGPAFKCLGAP